MSVASEAWAWGRFLLGLKEFLGTPITLKEARDIVGKELENRERFTIALTVRPYAICCKN